MPLIRLVILLLILSAITLFALQNWVPVLPLVILGAPTQALPLAVWMVAALTAGAITTLLLAALFKVSNTVAVVRRSPRRAAAPAPDPFPPPAGAPPRPPAAQTAVGYAQSDDGWEPSRRREEWDDWEDYVEPIDTPPTPAAGSRTVIQDDPTPNQSEREEREEWEDWEEDERQRTTSGSTEPTPSRSIYEMPQQPRTQYQSGSVYSYSYRDLNAQPDPPRPGSSESVYDADFRVIVPPYQPEAQPAPSPANDDDGEEDWGFDDDDFDTDKRRGRSAGDW